MKYSQSATAVRELLSHYHLRPDERRGQNFLIDDEVYDVILKAAALTLDDAVLEIGAGLGTLTERLAAAARRVVAVEVDERLVAVLRRRLGALPNVAIVSRDILRVAVPTLGLAPPYKVVANIPYNITGQIFKKFLTQDVPPASLTVLVQREVGERIVAAPGDLTLLALSVQVYGQPRLVRVVPRDCFWPVPAVDSAVLHVADVRPFPFADVPEKFFWCVVRVGFVARRKQLHNNLAAGLQLSPSVVQRALALAGVAARARAQDLSIESWHALAAALHPTLTASPAAS